MILKLHLQVPQCCQSFSILTTVQTLHYGCRGGNSINRLPFLLHVYNAAEFSVYFTLVSNVHVNTCQTVGSPSWTLSRLEPCSDESKTAFNADDSINSTCDL